MKDKLKRHFKKNNIQNYEQEDYNEHLATFKEAVLDDRLNYNQTHLVENLGDLFFAYWKLLSSSKQYRINKLISDHINKKGRLAVWDFEKPDDLNEIEEFFWEIRGRNRFDSERLTEYIPKTWSPLIEKETTKDNMIDNS